MTLTFNQLVESLVTDFQQVMTEEDNLEDQLRTFLLSKENDFRTVFLPMKGGNPKKMNKKANKKSSDQSKPAKTNWQAVWTSTEFGCSSYPPFADKIREIRDVAMSQCVDGKKPNQFKLNNELQTWAKGGDGSLYRGWKEYATEKLLAAGKQLPSDSKADAPKQRKPKVEVEIQVEHESEVVTQEPPPQSKPKTVSKQKQVKQPPVTAQPQQAPPLVAQPVALPQKTRTPAAKKV